MRYERRCAPACCRGSPDSAMTRIVQHVGLTSDGLRGMRLIIYIGMLADLGGWDWVKPTKYLQSLPQQ